MGVDASCKISFKLSAIKKNYISFHKTSLASTDFDLRSMPRTEAVASIFSLLCFRSTDPAMATLENHEYSLVLLFTAEVIKNEKNSGALCLHSLHRSWKTSLARSSLLDFLKSEGLFLKHNDSTSFDRVFNVFSMM